MSRSIVERIACALFEGHHGAPQCYYPWADLPEHKREAYCDGVREVLLAAIYAGFVIRAASKSPDAKALAGGFDEQAE